MNWIPIGLNWTILFKCLEMTIVVIWRYINKTELNWIELNCPDEKFPAQAETALTFCVSNIAGVSIPGLSGSVDMGTRGLALIIAITSAITVLKTSWVRRVCSVCDSTASRMCLVNPMRRSHEPPMLDTWGELNVPMHPLSCRNFSTAVFSESKPSSLKAPTKFRQVFHYLYYY